MKKTIMILILALSLALISCISAYGIALSPQKLAVDGQPVQCEKYNIDGYNYFKLRDIASLLVGTGSEFEVGWDAEARTVSITTGAHYTAEGTELIIGEDKSASARPSTQKIMIDGTEKSDLSVYNLGGNNFFKLRDLGEALGFEVDYDQATNTALIISKPLDEKQGSVMMTQYGNYEKCGAMVRGNGVTYAIARLYPEKAGNQTTYYEIEGEKIDASSELFFVIARNDDGTSAPLLRSSKPFEYLWLRDDGSLYVMNNEQILKAGTASGTSEKIYSAPSGRSLQKYMFYGDDLYVIESTTVSNVSSRKYFLKQVTAEGKTKELVSVIYDEATYFDNALYALDDCIYYVAGDGTYKLTDTIDADYWALYQYDLKTGKTSKVITTRDKDTDGWLYGMGDIAYIGSKAYIPTYSSTIIEVDLKDPRPHVFAQMPAGAGESYMNIYANGNKLYYQSSKGRGLWQVSQTGEFTRLITSPTANYEGSMVNDLCVIDMPIPYVNNILNTQVIVLLPGGKQIDYADFLGITKIFEIAD